MRIFIGNDPRLALQANVLAHSIQRRSSKPVSITMLNLKTLPITRKGLTEFTYSRYLVPWLCNYEGWGLFLDSDMLCLDDVAKLFALKDDKYGVMVVKNKMRFEWPSLMLFNNAKCKVLTTEYVQAYKSPQDFSWAEVGDLPGEWNHCCNYDEPKNASLAHYTQGVPCWFETKDSEYSKEWLEERQDMENTVSWSQIMAASVHARPVLERMFNGYRKAQAEQAEEMRR